MTAFTTPILAAARRLALMLCVLAAAGHALAAPAEIPRKTAFSTDLTDTWWNPAESGWGMQMVQTGNFIFVTIYAYGPDGKPVWFGGGVTSTGSATFTGKLYATTGPWFGGAFNPASVVVREAGTMSFEATSINTGTLTYTFDGVTVTKAIERQPLTMDDYAGFYATAITQTVSGCTDPAGNGAVAGFIAVQITQNGASMTFATQNSGGGTCTATGTYSQAGRNGRFDGPYTCSAGEVGNLTLIEMNNHVRQFSARSLFQSTNAGCVSVGRMTGVIPD